MALSHNSLENYYTTVFNLAQHQKYSIAEIENLIPFERDLYVEMISAYLKQIEEERQRQRMK
jgi:hypothetical protein